MRVAELSAGTPSPLTLRGLTLTQRLVLGISIVFLAWSIAGLIANPDFATGSAAISKLVLGIDFNGWHAVSGLAVFGPGVYFALRGEWAWLFALLAAGSLWATGAWALFDHRPAGLFPFQHNQSDAILHFGTGAAYARAGLTHFRRPRPD